MGELFAGKGIDALAARAVLKRIGAVDLLELHGRVAGDQPIVDRFTQNRRQRGDDLTDGLRLQPRGRLPVLGAQVEHQILDPRTSDLVDGKRTQAEERCLRTFPS